MGIQAGDIPSRKNMTKIKDYKHLPSPYYLLRDYCEKLSKNGFNSNVFNSNDWSVIR